MNAEDDYPTQPSECCQEHCTVGVGGMYGDQHCDSHCAGVTSESPAAPVNAGAANSPPSHAGEPS